MAWNNPIFEVRRWPDREVVDRTLKSFEATGYAVTNVTVSLSLGADFSVAPSNLDTAPLAEVWKQKGTAVRTFSFQFHPPGKAALTVIVERVAGGVFDKVTLSLGTLRQAEPDPVLVAGLTRLESALKRELVAVEDLNAIANLLPKGLVKHYELREAELQRLETLSAGIIERLSVEAVRIRSELEEEFKKRRDTLEAEYQNASAQLASDYAERGESMKARESALTEKLADIDDRDSRFVRRELRQTLKNELARSSERFELTAGTQKLRRPVEFFTIVLLFLFGAAAAWYTLVSGQLVYEGEDLASGELLTVMLKQLAFTAAFASTAIFFIRWNNRWFEQHAAEEFRLKRLNLDLDRASWIVEMALEWQKEKGSDIPIELVQTLSSNLFESRESKESPLHPADQLASAILGATAEAELVLPGGGRLKLDRKSLRQLQKADSND